MPMFPYDVAELADGPIRCLFTPIATALPESLADIIDQTDPYDPATDWVDFGATAGPFQANRGLTTAAYNIQQTTTAVRERVSEVTRSVVVNVAEIRPDIMRMLKKDPGNDTVATAAGVGARTKVPFGDIEDLSQYRMAFIGRRGKDQGIVTEPAPSAKVRGRLFGYVAYRVQVQADNLQLGFAEGDLASANVTFRLVPEPDQPEFEEHGYWVFEDADTSAASRLMTDTPVEVTLGEHTIPVYAQRHAYLINRLGRFMRELQESAGDLDADHLLAYLQSRSYELLCAMLPNLEKRLPEYEYRGYASREAMHLDDYDEQADRSPTLPEIREALSRASVVNGFDIFVHLKALVDPQLVRGWLTAQMAEAILQNSPSSPSANGVSASMSSTAKTPTSIQSAD